MDAKTKTMQAVESEKSKHIEQNDTLLENDGNEVMTVSEDLDDNAIPGARLEFVDEDDEAWLFC